LPSKQRGKFLLIAEALIVHRGGKGRFWPAARDDGRKKKETAILWWASKKFTAGKKSRDQDQRRAARKKKKKNRQSRKRRKTLTRLDGKDGTRSQIQSKGLSEAEKKKILSAGGDERPICGAPQGKEPVRRSIQNGRAPAGSPGAFRKRKAHCDEFGGL